MSAIKEIYTAISALSPTYDSNVTISVRNYDQIRNDFHEADAPMRMLLVGIPSGDAEDVMFVGVGSGQTMRIQWLITDRVFIRPAMQGMGLEDNTEDLLTYMDSYISAIQGIRAPTSQSIIKSIRTIPGVYYWPDCPEGTAYFGVNVEIIVEEFLS